MISWGAFADAELRYIEAETSFWHEDSWQTSMDELQDFNADKE